MPYKRMLFHSAAREKVLRGATALADAVRVTLGPKSKSVLKQKKRGDGSQWPLVRHRLLSAHCQEGSSAR